MRFAVASFYVLLGLFAVASSAPTTGSKSLAQLTRNELGASFFAHSTYSVGDELKDEAYTLGPAVHVYFQQYDSGRPGTGETATHPEAAAYTRSSALLLIQHAEETMGLKRPYIVQFTNLPPTSSLVAKTTGFGFVLLKSNDRGELSNPYDARVEACVEECKDPRATFRKQSRTGSFRPIFEKTILEKPTQKNVMGQCVEYLNTAFQYPHLYFSSYVPFFSLGLILTLTR
ncbi:hypothetical protein GGU10DRAFT_379758 [Lentinula aff. detonsa]|uniref:Uncharacterized protein n=1 Tax=Lentinula aff. detonsa TaxID=2804958 RepID=A0AA38KNX6_9AGAR|nr:hypothetical protein GGU10DRAFT_379758 [Lentinula aff. detonsa]